MKKLYTFKFALIAFAMMAACVACDNTTEQEPNKEPGSDDTKPTAFATVELSDATADTFAVTVDIEDYKGNYTILPVTQEELDEAGSVEEYLEWYLEDDIATYATDYSAVDNLYVFSGDCILNISEAWIIDPATTYMVLVAGVKGDGTYAEITTDIVISDEITTLEGAGGSADAEYPSDIELATADFGTIEISNVTSSAFDFVVTPSDNEMPYLLFAFTEEEYNTMCTSDQERILAIYETFAYLAPYYEYTFAEYIEYSSEPGVYEDCYEEMEANTKYYVVAFGIDLATYQPLTAIEVATVTTLDGPAAVKARFATSINRAASKRVFSRVGRL